MKLEEQEWAIHTWSRAVVVVCSLENTASGVFMVLQECCMEMNNPEKCSNVWNVVCIPIIEYMYLIICKMCR